MTPALTVVVPTYNQAALLARCLARLAEQTSADFEVVVVDDGSTDHTPALLAAAAARDPRVRPVRQPNAGPARARNRGIAEARAALIAFTDSDCEPARDWVERLVAAFACRPDAAGIEGRIRTTDDVGPFTHQVENLDGGLFCTANIAYRRAVLERVGGFDPDFFYGHEDTDLSLRVRAVGVLAFDPSVEVVHPPVPQSFWQIVTRPRVWMCQIVLHAKHPEIYVAGHGRGPFGVLLWHYGVRQLVERLGRFSGWLTRAPATYLKFVVAMLLQRVMLFCWMPAYRRRQRELARSEDRPAVERHAVERAFHELLYANEPVLGPPELDRFNHHTMVQLGPVAGLTVLDCGCGEGDLSVSLALAGARVIALDLAREALAVTAQRARAAGVRDRVLLVHGALEALPLADGCVDRVVGSLVLHHADPAGTGRELARVLVPGGRASFSENFAFNPLLNWARANLAGRYGIPRLGTETEQPLSSGDLAALTGKLRPDLLWPELLFFQLLDRQVFRYRVRWISRVCERLDAWLYARFPSMRHYSYRGTLVLHAPARESAP